MSVNIPASLDAYGCVELAVVERSGFIESRHLGAAVVTAPDGSVLDSFGDVDALVFPRSSLKPFQATTVLRAGVELDEEQTVLATASHSGSAEHVRVVEGLLARYGLTEDELRCPRDWPFDSAASALAKYSGEKRRVTMNCSGKHAAFLATCVVKGWARGDYLDPLHPLQRDIRSTIEEFTGEAVSHVGTDGCGAPLFALSLSALARGIGLVARGDEPATQALVGAVATHPWAIAGIGHPNTVLIEQTGLFVKGGAEGVLVVGAPDGTAVALKVLDGSARAVHAVAIELLARAGILERSDAPRFTELTTEPILGGGERVGVVRVAF
ncbi:MAG: asparaginase [Cryobacterium sp.]|nr:asparaginase [Cryobacterium sp.]